MSTLILSKIELDTILDVLADKVESISQQESKPNDFANYYSVFSKIFSFADRCKFNEGHQILVKENASTQEQKITTLLKSRIVDSELDTGSKNALLAQGIIYIKDLVALSVPIIKNFRNVGTGSIARIEKYLKENGLEFGMQPNKYF